MLKTAESCKRGHPDKICDQISDAILDECLKQDKDSRVAIEVMGGHNIIYVCGELTTNAYVNIQEIAKNVYKDIGYTDNIGVMTNIVKQSLDISKGVNTGGAGDQGIMIGYACNDNKDKIPNELYLARIITKELEKLQDDKILPDGKAQITINDDIIETIVISNQTTDEKYLKKMVKQNILENKEISERLTTKTKIYINPTGQFRIGGFNADTGLTGRKLAVDNYGPQIPIGGGSFCGKCPSKVDRSAAYMARKIAIDYLKESKSEAILVKLAYSIGIAKPVMVSIEYLDRLTNAVLPVIDFDKDKFIKDKQYNLTPNGIIKYLDLKKPIYYKTAQHGHFGNNFKWDK